MSVRIAGMGWVTPLGSDIESVWLQLQHGAIATAQPFDSARPNEFAYRVPAEALRSLPAHPRLRRASAISRFAAAAGLAALSDANIDVAAATRTALVFAISNGGVIYTRRFFADIVEKGPRAASPLLFPETVFNAPASHLAAMLGIDGISYTVVGGGAVGILAVKMAADLLESRAADRCLVVGAEECDPLLFRAYRRWRLCSSDTRIHIGAKPARGTVLSEGAAALLLTRDDGDIAIDAIDPGENFYRRTELETVVRSLAQRLIDAHTTVAVTSANGTFIDAAERAAIDSRVAVYTPKAALGDSVGASAIWQIICAAFMLRTGNISGSSNAVVTSCGMNQQVAGARLSRML